MAEWIKISPAGIYECSECGQNVMTSDIVAYRHCHGCGAIMREYEEQGKAPETCAECKHCISGNILMYRCSLVEHGEFEFINNSRRTFCPLKPMIFDPAHDLALEDYPDEDYDVGFDPFIGSFTDEV